MTRASHVVLRQVTSDTLYIEVVMSDMNPGNPGVISVIAEHGRIEIEQTGGARRRIPLGEHASGDAQPLVADATRLVQETGQFVDQVLAFLQRVDPDSWGDLSAYNDAPA